MRGVEGNMVRRMKVLCGNLENEWQLQELVNDWSQLSAPFNAEGAVLHNTVSEGRGVGRGLPRCFSQVHKSPPACPPPKEQG